MRKNQHYKLTNEECQIVEFARTDYEWAALVHLNMDDNGYLSLNAEACKTLEAIFTEYGFQLIEPQTELFAFMIHCLINCVDS
jgi:hypothetical protein